MIILDSSEILRNTRQTKKQAATRFMEGHVPCVCVCVARFATENCKSPRA